MSNKPFTQQTESERIRSEFASAQRRKEIAKEEMAYHENKIAELQKTLDYWQQEAINAEKTQAEMVERLKALNNG